jgi:hypothetical protein
MKRRPLTTVALLTTLILFGAGCGGGEPPAPSTTTGTALPTRTTLAPTITIAPESATTTTTPAQVATSVDACGLVESAEIALVVGDDPGPGVSTGTSTENDDTTAVGDGTSARDSAEVTAPPPNAGDDATATSTPDGSDSTQGAPNVLLSACTWPSSGPGEVTLSYLAPTTATSAREHLQRIIDLGTRFARGGRVLPLTPNGELMPAALINGEGAVLEVALVSGSALVYVVPADPPAGNTREANALLSLLLAAGRRAPG